MPLRERSRESTHPDLVGDDPVTHRLVGRVGPDQRFCQIQSTHGDLNDVFRSEIIEVLAQVPVRGSQSQVERSTLELSAEIGKTRVELSRLEQGVVAIPRLSSLS